jgi:hypothetical protein
MAQVYPSGWVRGRNRRPQRYEKHRLYLHVSHVAALRARGDLSASGRCAIGRYLRLVAAAADEVRAALDADELQYVAEAVRCYQDLQSWDPDPDMLRLAVGAAPVGLDRQHCVRGTEVDEALKRLSLAATCAVLDAVERYWAKWDRGVMTTAAEEIGG